jgi:hypothetical protein
MRTAPAVLFACAATVLIVSGCKKDDPERVDLGLGYFPTNIGHWVEYAVDSNWQDQQTTPGDSIHHSHFALREELVEAFTDPEGRAAQRIVRSRPDEQGAWVPQDVWWQTLNTTKAERTEENMRRVKLVFMPHTGVYWNTNAPNTQEAFELTYSEVDVPWSVNGMSFDSTLLVKTTYMNNLIVRRTYYERYAKHVGLVYRQVDSTNTQSSGSRSTWYKQVITDYAH